MAEIQPSERVRAYLECVAGCTKTFSDEKQTDLLKVCIEGCAKVAGAQVEVKPPGPVPQA
jgi:hypothetical protein